MTDISSDTDDLLRIIYISDPDVREEDNQLMIEVLKASSDCICPEFG
jgi:hypothetical protein